MMLAVSTLQFWKQAVLALVLLYPCQPGCWDCRRSCVRNWSSPVCWSGVDTTFPTVGSPVFLFHLRQYRTSRASLKDNGANEPLLSGVVSESCFVIRDNPVCCTSRFKIKRSNCRCAYYPNSTRHSNAYSKATWYLN